MSKTLTEIAKTLKSTNKKSQLIYAFNGTGKTRLSREFKELVSPKTENDEFVGELAHKKILYYSSFTEDLFYWDNDLKNDSEIKLKIHPNAFTDWVFKEQGLDNNVISIFQKYTSDKLTPVFNEHFSEVTFSYETGDDSSQRNIKISKGEESNFVWSVFYSLLSQVIAELNIAEPNQRSIGKFNNLKYIFIDDPVSSLDENHLIELAVDIAQLIKSSESELRFIITTHNPLFYNVLYNELNLKSGYFLKKYDDSTFDIDEKKGDSNKAFSYHLFLKQSIESAIQNGEVQKYHFTLLRNLYEKTANFLNYPRWSELLPENKEVYIRQINKFSHSTLSNDEVAEPTDVEKKTVQFLLEHLLTTYNFK